MAYSVLITGGAGFIGSHLAELLLQQGHTVTIADNLSRGKLANIAHIKKHIQFLSTDLRIEHEAHKATKRKDIVFNLAALNTGIDYDAGRTQHMFEQNMLLQMMPLKAAAANGVNSFVQVSSAVVYPRKALLQNTPVKETRVSGDPELSKQGYAFAKRMGEHLAKWYSETEQIKTIIARFTNVYGPRDHADELGHFLPVIIRKFLFAKDHVIVFGSGKQRRSFLHVQDAAHALAFLSEKGKSGEAYNIDPHDEHTIASLVYQVQAIMKKKHIRIIFDTTKPEGPQRRLLSNEKISRVGWRPTQTLLHTLPTVVKEITHRLQHEHS
jgi:UDP-glucose 4-epimerase